MPLPSIPISCYSCFHACHRQNVETTQGVETLGAHVVASVATARYAMLPGFIREVCKWGGGRGPLIAARILNPNNNTVSKIRGAFDRAIASLGDGHVGAALNSLVGLHGLGVSFASKHLRMLRPDLCGVLDSLVARAGLGYVLNDDASYVIYSADCSEQATALNAAGSVNSLGRVWSAGDVDMAVFAWIRSRTEKKPWQCTCRIDGHPLKSKCPSTSGTISIPGGLTPKLAPVANSGPSNTIVPSNRKSKSVVVGSASRRAKRRIYLDDKPSHHVRIIDICGDDRNNGVISKPPGHSVWLSLKLVDRSTSFLIGEIQAAGGNFVDAPDYVPSPSGVALGVGSGVGFQGGVPFPSLQAAVDYLKCYFEVDWCI